MGYKSPSSYGFILGSSGSAPNDSSTYYIGQQFASQASTNAAFIKAFIPIKGTIRRVIVSWYSVTVECTAEDVALSIRVNNTTDYALYTGSMANAASPQSVLDLNVPVEAGDYITLKMVTPAWVTNPTGFYVSVSMEINYG